MKFKDRVDVGLNSVSVTRPDDVVSRAAPHDDFKPPLHLADLKGVIGGTGFNDDVLGVARGMKHTSKAALVHSLCVGCPVVPYLERRPGGVEVVVIDVGNPRFVSENQVLV